MIQNTLILVGPGGIGKSPLENPIRSDAMRIDPYRLRTSGPRDSADMFYAHPRLRNEVYLAFERLGVTFTSLSETVQWFPQTNTVFIRVRNDWQALFLDGLAADVAKFEIYAPAAPVLLSVPEISQVFGNLEFIVLNPADSLLSSASLDGVKQRTQENCAQRGDADDSIARRVESIDEEAPAWRQMIDDFGATEYPNWQFPEYVYSQGDQTAILRDARQTLLTENPRLEVFLKTETEINES